MRVTSEDLRSTVEALDPITAGIIRETNRYGSKNGSCIGGKTSFIGAALGLSSDEVNALLGAGAPGTVTVTMTFNVPSCRSAADMASSLQYFMDSNNVGASIITGDRWSSRTFSPKVHLTITDPPKPVVKKAAPRKAVGPVKKTGRATAKKAAPRKRR